MLRAIFAGWIMATAALASQIVEGRVVNSLTGAGIAGVSVTLSQAGKPVYSATTGTEGRFRVDAVQDGVYAADYRAKGFWPVPNMLDRGTQRPVAVASGGDPVHLEVKMPPIARLSGRVLDGAGKAVPNAQVFLAWEVRWCKAPSCLGMFRTLKSDDKGEYAITDLALPGRWLFSAIAPESWKPPETEDGQKLGWAQTFYPGVADARMASDVMVGPGGDLWSLDIKLAATPVRAIRGKVLGIDGEPAPKAAVTLGRGYGAPVLHQEARDDGSFEFEVASAAGDALSLSATIEKDGLKLWATRAVEVERHDLENVDLRLTAPFSVRGKIVAEGFVGRLPEVMLAFDYGSALQNPGVKFLTGSVNARGSFLIQNVYPGPYQIVMADLPSAPYYLDSVRLGDRDARGGVEILSAAETLTVTVKSDGGTVRGTIEDCGGSRVLLVPQDPVLRREGYMWYSGCGQDGRFEFLAVRPGEYYGLAIATSGPTPWYQLMRDEEVLKQAGKVSVKAGESTAAEIRLVSR